MQGVIWIGIIAVAVCLYVGVAPWTQDNFSADARIRAKVVAGLLVGAGLFCYPWTFDAIVADSYVDEVDCADAQHLSMGDDNGCTELGHDALDRLPLALQNSCRQALLQVRYRLQEATPPHQFAMQRQGRCKVSGAWTDDETGNLHYLFRKAY